MLVQMNDENKVHVNLFTRPCQFTLVVAMKVKINPSFLHVRMISISLIHLCH